MSVGMAGTVSVALVTFFHLCQILSIISIDLGPSPTLEYIFTSFHTMHTILIVMTSILVDSQRF